MCFLSTTFPANTPPPPPPIPFDQSLIEIIFPPLSLARQFRRVKPKRDQLPLRACLHGGGGPQVGEVARLGGVTRLSILSF